jgi:hypothetical protein
MGKVVVIRQGQTATKDGSTNTKFNTALVSWKETALRSHFGSIPSHSSSLSSMLLQTSSPTEPNFYQKYHQKWNLIYI